MKAGGIVTMVVGSLVALVIALWPTSMDVGLGVEANCGPSLFRMISSEQADTELGQAVVDQCRSRAFWRVVVGGVIGVGAIGVGAVLLNAGETNGRRQQTVSMPPPGAVWDGQAWRPPPSMQAPPPPPPPPPRR